MLGNFLLQAGRLDEAMRAYEAVAAEAPDDPRPHFGIADVHKRRGDYARASASRRKAYELYGDDEAAGAFAGATTEAAYARAELTVARAELLMLEARAKERYIPALDFGRVHAQIGNREQALTWLERAFDEGHGTDVGLVLLKADQAWEPVRADPRFVEIVRRMGIP
jgi:tetratricopeptide (TPR) repeat protein